MTQSTFYNIESIGSIEELKPHILEMFENSETAIAFEINETERIIAYSSGKEPSLMLLVIPGREKPVIAIYPWVKNGIEYQLKNTEIQVLENENGAYITVQTLNGEHSITFYDTKHFKFDEEYTVGDINTYSLSAFAKIIELLKDKTYYIEGKSAIEYSSKKGIKHTINDDGSIEPIAIDCSKFVALIPKGNGYAEFYSPIKNVEKVSLFNINFYKLNIILFDEPEEISINLYAKESLFNRIPTNKDALRGLLWLQGYLKEHDEN